MADYPTAPEGTSARAFFDSMEALGFEYAGATGEGGRFQCPHPGHEDERPSLDVTIGRNGKPLLNCKVCEQVYEDHDEWFRDVKQAGVRFAGLPCEPGDVNWGERAATTPGGSHRVKGDGSERVNVKTITYDYNHEDGTPNFRAYRVQWKDAETGKPDKTFFVRRYQRGGGRGGSWPTGFAEDTERTPWKLERFADWAEAHDVLYLVEGEKAARALHKIKQPATTFQGGSGSPLADGWVERYGFGRFAEVRVWPDADGAGVKRAKALLSDLKAAGVNAKAWGLADETVEPKDDAFDIIRRGDFERTHELRGGDAAALAALNPLPSKPEKTRQERPEPASLTLSDGTVLVSAAGLGGRESDAEQPEPVDPDQPEPVDPDQPYSVCAIQSPYVFAGEYLDRLYTDADGVLLLRFADLRYWLWCGTHYRPLEPAEVQARVVRDLDGKQETTPDGETRRIVGTRRFKSEMLSALQDRTLVSEHGAGTLAPAKGGVPFRNGWLDVKSGELQPLTPDRDVRWVVPGDYDPDAAAPKRWLKFLASLGWTEDTQEYRLLRQWFGYVLSGDTRHQKALMLVGPKRAGKGTIIDVAEAMMGEGSVGLDLSAFSTNFGLSPVIGKGLASIGDARFEMKTDKAMVRRILSLVGQDTITIDRKHKDPVSVKVGARLMIASNELPSVIEASDALASRFLFLKLTQDFYGKTDPDLLKKLLPELPGIVKWALAGLEDLTNEGRFSETEAGLDMQKEMTEISNPIRIWVEEECVLSPDAFTFTDDLHSEFAVWAEHRRYYVPTPAVFARDLNAAYPDSVIRKGQKRRGDKPLRGYHGIKLAR